MVTTEKVEPTASTAETAVPTAVVKETGDWQNGVIGGLAGGLVFGALMSLMMPMAIENAIPALWGLEGGLAGWLIHMANAAILGVVFVALIPYVLEKPTVSDTVGFGVVYGAILWVVLAVLVMPVWLSAVGFAGAPPLPNINWMSFLGHIAYGAILGGVYAALAAE